MSKTLQELATEARRINAANGWGGDFQIDHLPRYLALIHSEITEAWQETEAEGQVRELGDVVVRALDLGELIQPGLFEDLNPEGTDLADHPWAERLMVLHTLVSETLERYRKAPDPVGMQVDVLDCLGGVILYTLQLMHALDPAVRPVEIIASILAANAERSYRHGGRRA